MEENFQLGPTRSEIIENASHNAKIFTEKEDEELQTNESIIKQILKVKRENKILEAFHSLKKNKNVCMLTMNSNGIFHSWTPHFRVFLFFKKGYYRL